MMMMGPSRASSSRFLPVAGFVIFIAVVFFATGFQASIRGFFAELIAARNESSYGSLSRSEVEERLRRAEIELTRTKYQAVLYELLVQENRNLRTVSSAETITATVTARVLARPPKTHYDTLLLGAGSASGISANDAVIFNGMLLGKVISTTASSATVELFSTPKSEHDAILGNPSAVAIARGLGGGAYEIQIPQGVEIFPGDSVRAATDDTLLLGTVVSVSGSATDATKTVHVAVPVSMNDIDFVSVVPQGDI